MAAQPTVSIILNIHNEARFLRRTMDSLEEAVRYAIPFHISCEIICVLDRSDATTIGWIEAYDFPHFIQRSIVHANNGSLGLSRNDGISRASGQYIYLCDADDLISYNMIAVLHQTAICNGEKSVLFPEFVVAFGSTYAIGLYFGTDIVSKMSFFQYHPYVSRVFAHRALFDIVKFDNADLNNGYAYEDWHFNCESLAHGYEFVVASQTILFYRQRPGSLLRSANLLSTRLPRYSTLHHPKNFLAVCKSDLDRGLPHRDVPADDHNVRESLLSNPLNGELIERANITDPAIDPVRLMDCRTFSNYERHPAVGAAYYQLCDQLGQLEFSHIFLLPFLASGETDRYILHLIDALLETSPDRKILIVSGQPVEHHSWIERLEANVTFVDVPALDRTLTTDKIELIAFRLIQACGRGAPIFLKACDFALGFFERFHAALPENTFYFLRLCDEGGDRQRGTATLGRCFDFLSEYGNRLTGVIADNSALAKHDAVRLDLLRHKIHVIVPPIASGQVRTDPRERQPSRKVLWASRLGLQQRPGLLIRIGRLLDNTDLAVSIDIFGSGVSSSFDAHLFDGISCLSYRGPLSDLSALQPHQYDALIYTGGCAGTPNIVLEAMDAGLIVIAADVGGLSEIVTPRTGFLLQDNPDEESLARQYVGAIRLLYEGKTDLASLSLAAEDMVRRQYSHAGHLQRVRQLFPLVNR